MGKVIGEQEEIWLSIVVPVYNAESYLCRCVDSILAQTFKEFELILVDDGSGDCSGEICDEYAQKDRRVKVIHIGNGGSVTARKTGISFAKGKYIGFVDADDYIEPIMFEELLKSIKKCDADFIHTGYIEECPDSNNYIFEFEDGLFDLPQIEDREKFLTDYVLCAYKGRIRYSLWSKLFRRELITKCFLQLPEEQQLGEDLLCLCLCIMESKRILLRKHALYHYVVRISSLSHMPKEDFIIKNVELCHYIIGILKNYIGKFSKNMNQNICCYLVREFVGMIALVKNESIRIQCFYIKNIDRFRGMKIVLYGAGKVGQDYYAQICRYNDIKIAAWIDSDSKNCKFEYTEVLDISSLSKSEYELIIIAVKADGVAKEIENMLLGYGISRDKIFWESPSDILEDGLFMADKNFL